MILNLSIAISAFRKVKQVQEELQAYCLAADRPDLSVEDLRRIIEQMYRLKIEMFEAAFEGSYLRGMIERYSDRCRILVKKNQEEDWKRFVAVKELCHVVNDEEEDWSPKGADTIKSLLAEAKIPSEKAARRVAQSEMFAEWAAVELLYPYASRVHDRASLNCGGSGLSLTKIATYHKIPEVIVETALSDEYHDLMVEIWNGVK